MRIAVIGTGNGGHAIAGDLSLKGHDVYLYGRNLYTLNIIEKRGIRLEGAIEGTGFVSVASSMQTAIRGADVIMIATVANAHGELAQKMAPWLVDGQVIILNPGRTGGALEFMKTLKETGCKKHIYLGEAQTLIYACRVKEPGVVNIIGIKNKVMLAGLPAINTDYIIDKVKVLYSCFIPVKNVLITSLENIGAVFHPGVILFNAAAIERGNSFYFYREITPGIAAFIEKLDRERMDVGKAFGISLISAIDWVSFSYNNVRGETLCERMQNNSAYYNILAPKSIYCRQLLEDIPTGFVPLLEFGKIAGIRMPLFESILPICSVLLGVDFHLTGRTLDKMGLKDCNIDSVYKKIN
jgi:opine dehydrogenase